MYVYVCMCMCMYVHTYIHVHVYLKAGIICFNLANLASSGFFANISYRKYYKNDHIFAVKYNTSFTLYLK